MASNYEYEKELHNASRIELFIAIEKNKARRNGGIFIALISLVFIYWQDWNKWSLIVPIIFAFFAILAQSNIILFSRELKHRTSDEQ